MDGNRPAWNHPGPVSRLRAVMRPVFPGPRAADGGFRSARRDPGSAGLGRHPGFMRVRMEGKSTSAGKGGDFAEYSQAHSFCGSEWRAARSEEHTSELQSLRHL